MARCRVIFYCRNCEEKISKELARTPVFGPMEDCEAHIPLGMFRVAGHDDRVFPRLIYSSGAKLSPNVAGETTADREFYLVNRNDLVDVLEHPDDRRLTGCCGLDGMVGPNLICKCGHELGTEYGDCWMPHFVALYPSLVSMLED